MNLYNIKRKFYQRITNLADSIALWAHQRDQALFLDHITTPEEKEKFGLNR